MGGNGRYDFIDRYIYSLLDPRENKKIVYVGQSIHPHKRYDEHLADYTNKKKGEWLDELAELNLEPILKIEKVVTSSQFFAFEWEMHFTVVYRDLGYKILSVSPHKIDKIYSLRA